MSTDLDERQSIYRFTYEADVIAGAKQIWWHVSVYFFNWVSLVATWALLLDSECNGH